MFFGIVPSTGISKSGMLEYSDFFPLTFMAGHKIKLGDGDSLYKVGPYHI